MGGISFSGIALMLPTAHKLVFFVLFLEKKVAATGCKAFFPSKYRLIQFSIIPQSHLPVITISFCPVLSF